MYGASDESEETPRTLIRQFLKNAKTAKLSAKKQSRIASDNAGPVLRSSAKKSASKISAQKQVAARALTRSSRKRAPPPLFAEDVAGETPRTLLRGFIQHAPIRTPAVHIPKKKTVTAELPSLQVTDTVLTRKRTRASSEGNIHDDISDSFETKKTPTFKRRREQRMSVGTFGRGVQAILKESEADDEDSQAEPTVRETRVEDSTDQTGRMPTISEADLSIDLGRVPNFKRRAQQRLSLGTFGRGVKERMVEDYGSENITSQNESSIEAPEDQGEIGQPQMESTQDELDAENELAEMGEDPTIEQQTEQQGAVEKVFVKETQDLTDDITDDDVDHAESNLAIPDSLESEESVEFRESNRADMGETIDQADGSRVAAATPEKEQTVDSVAAERGLGGHPALELEEDGQVDEHVSDDEDAEEYKEDDDHVPGSSADELDDFDVDVSNEEAGQASTSGQVQAPQPARPPVRRRARKPPAMKTTLSMSLTKNIFTFYSKAKVNPQAMQSVYAGSEKFLQMSFQYLQLYTRHANRKTVSQEDVELLMKRQRFITDKQSLNALIEKNLPLEYRQRLVPIARSGNKVEPKLK